MTARQTPKPSLSEAADAVIPDAGSLPTDSVLVGRIREAWGIAGAFRVEPFNDPHDSVLRATKRWWLVPGPDRLSSVRPGLSAPEQVRQIRISRCRVHGDGLVAQSASVPDRTAAEALKGFQVYLSRADFPRASSGEYYWIDLIDCQVFGQGDVLLGTVSALDDHGAHPILIIVEGDHERMVPFVDQYIVNVDLPSRRIRVDWHPDW